MSGEIQLEDESIDFSDFLVGLRLLAKKTASDQDAEMQKESREWRSPDVKARLAFSYTVIAIVLLCFSS